MKLKFLFLLIFLVVSKVSFGQEVTIKGVVKDDTDILPGATVLVKGTTNGVTTDFDGNFSIVMKLGEIFVVKYLGFSDKEVLVSENKFYTVILEADASELDEIIVVGYGSQKKTVLTSSVAQIKGEDLAKEPVLNPTQALQGKAAGVQIIASDAPGQASTVIIRGLGTIQGGREPLYVVDGVLTNNINNINSSDIESMNILKDAASLAIYGNRGANGVVIVTTKKGKTGKMKVSFNYYTGVRDILKRVEMANAAEFVTYSNEATLRDLQRDNDPNNDNIRTQFFPTNQQYDTNWLDEITRLGKVADYNLSLSGGSEEIKAFFSVGFNEEEGILQGNNFNRLTIRSNVDYKISEKLDFSHKVGVQLANGDPQGFGLFTAAYKQAPILAVRDDQGRFGSSTSYNNVANPAIDASNLFKKDKNKFFKIQGAFQMDYEVYEDLKFTSRFSIETEYGRFYSFRDRLGDFLARSPQNTTSSFEGGIDNPANTRLTVTHTNTYRWFLDNYFTYEKTFNENHNFKATLGVTSEENRSEFLSGTRNNVPLNNNLNFNLITGDEDDTQLSSGSLSVLDRLYSYIARVNYDYKDKYIFNASYRRDGSSKFTKGNQFGDFFAVSAGWVLTKEDFMENSLFNTLKLRGSYGELGNQNVPFNVITTTTGAGGFYAFGPNQDLQQGTTITATIQENLSWEVTTEFNFGIEFTLFDYKLSGEFDAYQRTNTNATLQIELPDVVGLDPFNSQVGEVQNRGLEFSLNWSDKIGDEFKYRLGGNFSYNENELTKVFNPFFNEQIGGFINNGQYTKKIAVGQPLGSFYLYDIEGIDDRGEFVYKDVNENGIIDEGDRQFFGSSIPKFYFGLNAGFDYKNFDFSVDAFANFGNMVYNGKKAQRFGNENIEQSVFNSRWTTGRPSNTTPRAFNDVPLSSTYYLESGDFFRINNITLGYTLPEEISNKFGKIRVYASAKNPFIFQKFSGFTPELPGDPLGGAGIELDAYPTLRSFYVGINASF